MILSLIILYSLSLIWLATTERFRTAAAIMSLQGWILMGIALLRLHSLNWAELLFVVAETVVFKAIIVPAILFSVIHRTKINRIQSSGSSQVHTLLLSIAALIASASLTYYVADRSVNVIFLAVALYALLSGLILIVLRRRIFPHLVGFLVIENGVFLFSMAVGVEMPHLINIAIMLDILISILLLGLFTRKIDEQIHSDDTDLLTHVKD
uniref:hypothetical protein n=1 Tax=Alistipes sp. TaxID=1872444 RepID=UPI0040569259